ncbi:hypothetical protein [Nocardia pseudovaccinii]|uniref:hypothetical protein n=1 Tax=Nocardia pseudovaccinii TaxID=189540 RepID=UPI0007A4DA8D|nr:hypothetical protein [Nocardia pseudovaccinii]
MRTPDEPTIDALARIDDNGYRARSLCVVDHQPADITVTVKADGRFRATVRVFDQMSLSWHLVLRVDHLDYQRLPADPGQPDTLDAVRASVRELHATAVWIARTARHNGSRW